MVDIKRKLYGKPSNSADAQTQKAVLVSANSDTPLVLIILTITALVIFLGALFFLFKAGGEIKEQEEHQKVALKKVADKYIIASIDDVVDNQSSDPIKGYLAFQKYIENITEKKSGYNHSIPDIIGATVQNVSGTKLGVIEDIFIHRWNREAKAFIKDSENKKYLQDLEYFRFKKKLLTDKADTVIQIPVGNKGLPKNQLSDVDLAPPDWISLQKLHNGQVYDYQNREVGRIITVVYGNDEIQGFYLDLCPLLKKYHSQPVFIPFQELQFTQDKNKIDITLTENQTFALSKCIFEKK